MPEVFEKGCKIKVIQYGEHSDDTVSFLNLKNLIIGSFKKLFKN